MIHYASLSSSQVAGIYLKIIAVTFVINQQAKKIGSLPMTSLNKKRAAGLTGRRAERTIAPMFRLGTRRLIGKVKPRLLRGFFIFNASILAHLNYKGESGLSRI
jgi:hypothetical protein